jgi:hypothetical protein
MNVAFRLDAAAGSANVGVAHDEHVAQLLAVALTWVGKAPESQERLAG